jgi:hypothetical protein
MFGLDVDVGPSAMCTPMKIRHGISVLIRFTASDIFDTVVLVA